MAPDLQPLRALCGGEARFRLVKALYEAPQQAFRARALAGAAGVDPGQAHRLLREFVRAGLCEDIEDPPHRSHHASRAHPITRALADAFGETRGPRVEAPRQVDLAAAPVLRSLLWTGRERERIGEEEAFRQYERNWRFVKGAPMTAGERKLLERLTREFGRGVVKG